MQKNTASQKWIVFAFGGAGHASEGQPITGDAAQITANLRLDGGAANAVDDTNPTELEDGYYVFDVTQAETNANLLHISPESSTANVEVIGVPGAIYTTPTTFNASAIALATALATAQTDLDTITGSDGSTLATAQGNYAPAKAGDSMDMSSISGDSVAADNLELQYDTTGLTGDTFPATQSQVGNLSNVGSATHRPAASYTLTTGTQSSGTVSSTEALDQTRHEHTDTAGVMELYYEFNVGSGVPSSAQVTGYVTGNNDDIDVYGFDWVASAWVQIGNIQGLNATVNRVFSFDMFVNMVGSAGNEGVVRVRFFKASGLTTALLAIDQIFVAFSQGVEGYENAAVWFDSGASNTNTVVDIDGVARNPVSSAAALNTLLTSTNLSRVEVYPGSTLTLGAAQANRTFDGDNWTLALGGQSIAGSSIFGADISGTGTGVPHEIHHCDLGVCSFAGGDFFNCGLADTMTLTGTVKYEFIDCYHAEAGAPSTIDFGAALGASEVHIHNWHGNLTILNMDTGDILHFSSADGTLTLDSSCTAGTVNLAGTFGLTDSSSGMTINDNGQMYQRIGAPVGADISADVAAIPTTAMRGTDGANTVVPPSVAQFNARTQPTADYVTAADILTTALTEAYNADGVDPTLSEAIFVIMQALTEFSISTTTMTVKKLDGSTTAYTGTLDDADNPSSLTRAT